MKQTHNAHFICTLHIHVHTHTPALSPLAADLKQYAAPCSPAVTSTPDALGKASNTCVQFGFFRSKLANKANIGNVTHMHTDSHRHSQQGMQPQCIIKIIHQPAENTNTHTLQGLPSASFRSMPRSHSRSASLTFRRSA